MRVRGEAKLSIWLNVYDLETEAVEDARNGHIIITDPDQFFMDWAAAWDEGIGELLGTTDEDSELEKDEEEDE